MDISIVIIAKHAEKTIHHTLTSLLRQTKAPNEILLVVDSPADPTLDSIEEYPVQVKISKGGVGAARKKGVNASTGDIIAFIDSDAVADEKWIESISQRFKESNVKLLAGKTIEVNDLSSIPSSKPETCPKEITLHFAPTMNLAFKKSLIAEIGNFDPAFKKGGEDTDFCAQARKKGVKIFYEPRAMVYHLKHTFDMKRRWRDGRSRCKVFFKHPSYAWKDMAIVLFHICAIIASLILLVDMKPMLSLLFLAPSLFHRLYRATITIKKGTPFLEGLWNSFSMYVSYFSYVGCLVTQSIKRTFNIVRKK